MLNLAVCYHVQGRYASSWAALREAASMARRDGRRDREQLALELLSEVEPKVSHLVIMMAKAAIVPGLVLHLCAG